jgi:peptidyl-prolyl cis-trans isomerase D
VTDIYKVAKGETGRTEGKDANDRIVFRVTDVVTPAVDPNSEQAKKISDQLKNAIADELLSQYVVRLQTDLGTSINQVALDQAIGRSAQQ